MRIVPPITPNTTPCSATTIAGSEIVRAHNAKDEEREDTAFAGTGRTMANASIAASHSPATISSETVAVELNPATPLCGWTGFATT